MRIKKGLESEYNSHRELNTKDDYSKAIVEYAERWGDMMEQRIDQGMSVAESAAETKYEADTEGISGYMYGCAVQTLSKFWEHGEELREWHNGEHNYNGQGVANPAVINIADENTDTEDMSPTLEM